MQPRVLILRAPGTNCDQETAHAFSLAGGVAERWHVNRVLAERGRLGEFQIFCIPGGFSYGDDVAAGRILGNQIRHHLADALHEFRAAGKLILGICNGMQVLVKSGLLVEPDEHGPAATLTWNDSGRFEDRWVRLEVEGNKSVFLSGIEELELPIAHAEGKFVARNPLELEKLNSSGQLVLRYKSRTEVSSEELLGPHSPFPLPPSALSYPDNPNGSMGNVAGVCDHTGQVLGLMPHPERYVDPTQHPSWTRRPLPEIGAGLCVFQNAVRYYL